jgi:DNA-binding transcriptional regulator YdaS (Cro superfamily)
MEALHAYLKTLSPKEQSEFAVRCGTSLNYLRKSISLAKNHGKKIGMTLAVEIERESGGAVRCEQLLPDVDWRQLRTAAKKYPRPDVAA